MNNIGKMHLVKQYYWLLFPSKETAATALGVSRFGVLAVRSVSVADGDAAYWSRQFNCNVSNISPNDFVVLLETDEQFKKVLTCNGDIGWIWVEYMFKDYFEEVTAK